MTKNSYMRTNARPFGWRRLYGLLAFLLIGSALTAQTTLIDPTGAGGFELGSTFVANGWTVSNSSSSNDWVIGTTVGAAPMSNNKVYVSNDGGVTNNYTPTSNSTIYFYRDVTVPAGE